MKADEMVRFFIEKNLVQPLYFVKKYDILLIYINLAVIVLFFHYIYRNYRKDVNYA